MIDKIADVQADLSLHWGHISEGMFTDILTQSDYILFQLIIMFNTDPEFSSVVKVLLQSICSRSLDLFQGGKQSN